MSDPRSVPAGFGLTSTNETDTSAPVDPTSAPVDPKGPHATSAGKGGLAILGAKVFFIVTGLIQQPLLMRVLGLAEYGALSRIMAPSNIFNNVTVSASIQSASRTVAGASDPNATVRRILRVHAVLALLLFVVFAALAPVIGTFQGSPEIIPGLLLMACVLGLYAVYAPLVGSLNGRRSFVRQAGLDVTAATMRTVGLVGVGYLFARASLRASTGATAGALFAAGCIFPIALVVSHAFARGGDASGFDRRASSEPAAERGAGVRFSTPAYLKGIAGLAIAQFFTNALMQVDIMLLGHYLSAADSSATSHEWVGVYRSCQLFAFLPYQLLVSVTQVLFPLVAKAHAEGDREKVATLTARGLRIGVVAMGLLVSVVAAMPRSIIQLVYPTDVAEGGHATLHVLAIGQGLFAVLGLCTTVLASLGRERRAAVITGVATLAVALFQVWFVNASTHPTGATMLGATARATTLGMAAAVLLAAWSVKKYAGTFAPPATLLRVGAALALAFFAGFYEPHVGKLVSLVLPLPIVLAYALFMMITGELRVSELTQALRKLRKR